MRDPSKTYQELIEENTLLKQRIRELEISEADHKREQEALRSSELRYQTIFETTGTAMLIIEEDMTISLANHGIDSLTGYTREEIAGKRKWTEFVEKSDLEKMMALHQLRREDSGFAKRDYEFRLVHRDGYLKDIFLTVDLIPGTKKSVASLIDITERKHMEEALHESEERFRAIADYTYDWESWVGPDKKTIWTNPAVFRFTGYTIDEYMGITDTLLSLVDEASVAQIKRAREAALQGESTNNVEFRIRCKDGSMKWAAVSYQPIYGADGANLGYRSSVRDITDRKQAEQALRESEERYRSIIENIEDGYFEVDVSGSLTFFNESLRRIFDYPREELLGMNNRRYTSPETAKRVFKEFNEMYRTNIPVKILNYEIFRKDGSIRHLEVSASPIRDNSGILIGCRGIARDVTERYKKEEEKEKLKEQLQQLQKLEAIGTLAGGIAHDFNNLLMGIQGYASLSLMNLDPSHPNYERIKRIEEQVQSGADLTRQLLGFARGGRYEVKPADMNDILEKSSSLFGRTKKEISIHRKFGKDIWSVELDRGQMDQVFMNLFVNAWQAMPGGGEIYLETENIILDDEQALSYTVHPGRYVKISMTDTGTGMDAKTRERIFDPFFTTKAMGRGTGLGLATVYGIIKGHGGLINVCSEPGHGTTFTIYLPASEKEVVQEKAAAGTIDRGTETILLVDDEKMILEVSKELLESMGYTVYAAGSGQEAIAVYMEKRNKIDLIILDMIMPGISGGETFDRLREINPGAKVILSSGYSITGQAQEILDRGCNGFLQKPFHAENLSTKVREILG